MSHGPRSTIFSAAMPVAQAAPAGGPQPGQKRERHHHTIPVDGERAQLKRNRMHCLKLRTERQDWETKMSPAQSDSAFVATNRCAPGVDRRQRWRQGGGGCWRQGWGQSGDQLAPGLAFARGHLLPALGVLQELLALFQAQTGKLGEGADAPGALLRAQSCQRSAASSQSAAARARRASSALSPSPPRSVRRTG